MNGKCAKCGREREGDRYKLYIAKKEGEQFKYTFTDLHAETFFICDRCARTGKAGIPRATLIIFGLMGLPLLAAGVAVIAQDGWRGNAGYIIFSLVLLAPAVWGAYALITAKPTQESGEYAALRPAFLQLKASGQPGQALIAPSDMKQLIPLHPELQGLLLTAQVRAFGSQPAPLNDFIDSDLPAIREYMQYQARQWWEAGGADPALCDRCNGEVPRGYGCLMGASLYHAHCFDSLLDEGLPHLRRDPDWFLGRGVLQKAREFAANKQPTP